ncbi:hypothetical protein JCM16358_12640 [Halanaerocella petrolearia]
MNQIGNKITLVLVVLVVVAISSVAGSFYFNQNSQDSPVVEDDVKEDKVEENKEDKQKNKRQDPLEKAKQNKKAVDADKLLVQARELYYQGDYQASIAKYQQLAESTNSKQALSNLATIYEELGNYQQVVEEYQKLLQLDASPEVRLGLGVAYYNLGQLETAKEQLMKVIKQSQIDYKLRETNYYLGLIYKEMKRYDLAKKYFQQAVKLETSALAYYQLGEVEFAKQDYSTAKQFYQQALQTDGSLKGVSYKLALSYLKLDKIQQAINYFKTALNENSNNQLAQDKLDQLKQDYPEYFESKTTPGNKPDKEPLTREDLPQKVDFKFIKPLSDPGPTIRVGIIVEKPQLFFRVGSDFLVKQNEEIIARGQKGEIVKAVFNDGKYQLEFEDKIIDFTTAVKIVPEAYASILVHNVEYGTGYYWGGREDRQYRGLLELKPRGEGITAVNLVRLEEYLQAVIPSEMSASWPAEALKVQAVAARSYTLANLGKHGSQGFDLCSTVHCAAYRGLGREHKSSNQAVQATAGEVMTYNGDPINAVYSANSGGHTEDSEDIWSGKVPYLRGVSTEVEESKFPLSPVELKEWLKEVPASYSAAQEYTKLSHYRWQRNLSVDYLEDKLGITDIKQILPTSRGEAGSVQAVLVTGADQEKKITSGLRWKFGGLRSNRFWIQPQYQNGKLVSFLFYGSGWGHSVGMDQVAVAGMADSGKQYQNILQHFYTGVKIEDWY